MSKISIPGNFGSKSNSLVKLNQSGSDWSPETKANSEGGETDSDMSESENFLAKGAFLLTPSYELSMEKASAICEKMNLKSAFSLTKTATGILFKFANPEDYHALFKKGFHKVTGARFYKKVPIPCRPQKTFTIFVSEIPEEIPEEDIRHSLYKFNSVVEVTRLQGDSNKTGTSSVTSKIDSGVSFKSEKPIPPESSVSNVPPPLVRVTLATAEEANLLLQTGLDFFGATYFPTDTDSDPQRIHRLGRQSLDQPLRYQNQLPVFDATSLEKVPPPTMKMVRPRGQEFGNK